MARAYRIVIVVVVMDWGSEVEVGWDQGGWSWTALRNAEVKSNLVLVIGVSTTNQQTNDNFFFFFMCFIFQEHIYHLLNKFTTKS